jgi:hypothetical protein
VEEEGVAALAYADLGLVVEILSSCLEAEAGQGEVLGQPEEVVGVLVALI